jgi:hypothetical protein
LSLSQEVKIERKLKKYVLAGPATARMVGMLRELYGSSDEFPSLNCSGKL